MRIYCREFHCHLCRAVAIYDTRIDSACSSLRMPLLLTSMVSVAIILFLVMPEFFIINIRPLKVIVGLFIPKQSAGRMASWREDNLCRLPKLSWLSIS